VVSTLLPATLACSALLPLAVVGTVLNQPWKKHEALSQ
jgi:hypothetical protein